MDLKKTLGQAALLLDQVEGFLPLVAAFGGPAVAGVVSIINGVSNTIDTVRARAADIADAQDTDSQAELLEIAKRLRDLRKRAEAAGG